MSCSLAGRCCESGDLVAEEIMLPENIKRGDRVAVLTTGAYNYSMASNYNRLTRPPIIMIKDGADYTAVKRESLEDLTSLDI
jgi:diaminopimelate decarboxylase